MRSEQEVKGVAGKRLALGLLLVVVLLLGMDEGNVGGAATAAKPGVPATTDLVIDGIEVVQSIQDLEASVPLVMGKRTFVRVYAHSTEGTHLTTARLRLQSGAVSTTLLPIAPGGYFVKVRPSYLRLMPSHAFLFEIPKFWTFFSQFTVTAEVNPNLWWWSRSPQESSYANNTLSRSVSLEPVPPLHVMVVTQPYTVNGQTFAPSFYDVVKLYAWLRDAYPVGTVKLYVRSLPAVAAQRQWNAGAGDFDLTLPSCGWLNARLAASRFMLGGLFLPADTVYYGMVDAGGGFMRGCAPIGGMIAGLPGRGATLVRVASGPTGSATFGWDLDGTYGDWYGGHEIAHAFGRAHVRGGPGPGGCGEDNAVAHYTDGRISPVLDLFDPGAIYGFDAWNLGQGTTPIYGPNWHDVMTYCDYQWIDDITYQELLDAFQVVLPRRAAGPAAPEELLGVFGVIDVAAQTAELEPGFTVMGEAPTHEAGTHELVLRSERGGEIARYTFTPEENEPGRPRGEEEAPALLYIAELIPAAPEAARLEVVGPGGQVLATMAAGLGAPTVEVLTPNGGETLRGEVLVQWEASDPDGDPLSFHVMYSADGGESWIPVAVGVSETEIRVAMTNLVSSDSGVFRVMASDGLHTAVDFNDGPVTVPNHTPQVEIVAPAGTTTMAVEQSLALEAEAYDIDLGSLGEGELTWYSSEDGLLGHGERVTVSGLSSGPHEITLVADDGQGAVVEQAVTVVVEETPLDLPPATDRLLVGPELVMLDTAQRALSSPIFVENEAVEQPLTWTAAADVPWLRLSETEGETPQQVSLAAVTAGLEPGTYWGTLTFMSEETRETVTVRVYLVVSEYRVMLPMVR